jgi:D-serine dehydratase
MVKKDTPPRLVYNPNGAGFQPGGVNQELYNQLKILVFILLNLNEARLSPLLYI